MDYAKALAYLDEHTNLERMLAGRIDPPSLERMARLTDAMGDPQQTYPVIHVTGTNGKGSTAQIITRLLMAQGLRVGTVTSPHLERVNERIALDGEPIDDETFAEQVGAIADLEIVAGVRPSYFEILTAAAFRCFADAPVDVAVVEVGLLGRWDATNVADGTVAVVTNVGLDHTEYAGPTRADIAGEKAGHREAGVGPRARRDRARAGRHLPGRGRRGGLGARPRLRGGREPAGAGRPCAQPAHAARLLSRAVPAAERRPPG